MVAAVKVEVEGGKGKEEWRDRGDARRDLPGGGCVQGRLA